MNSTTPLVDAAVNDTAFEDKNQPHTDWITAHAGREIEARLNEARRELSEARAALLLSREMHNDCERERQSCVVEFDSAVGQLTEMDKQLAESHAREAQLREALDAIARRMHVMGSTGEFREGQLDALSAVAEQARIALTLPAPPVVPVEDVKPLIKALADVIALATFWGPDRYSNDLERAKISLSTFTAKHKP